MILTPLAVALALAGAAAVYLVFWWFRQGRPALLRAMDYGRIHAECGHLAPPPTDKHHAQMLRVCRFFVNGFVGKLDVRGAEKLASLPSPFILAFNHGSLLDTAIAPVLLNRKARFPAAQGVMKAAGCLVAWLFSRWGVYSVDLDNGAAAMKASVKVLTAGDGADIIVIFPEAWTNMDGSVRKFKTGAVRMAREAGRLLGKPVPVVPGYMHYGRYLPGWMTKLPIPVQWLMPLVGVLWFRRGCTVVIGEPISVDELPADHHEATEVLRERVLALKP